MNTIVRHIEYLISRKGCVIIPGIGAILAIDIPARILSDGGTVLPPSRSYSFNSDLSVSDGMLVASVAREFSISFETAARRVEQSTESIMNCLKTSGSFVLGSLGTLIYDADNHSISFNASESDIISTRNLWLVPIALPTIVDKSSVDTEQTFIINKHSLFKRAIRVAASIALLIGICFVASTPVAVKDAALASLAPELRQLTPADFHTPSRPIQLTIVAPAEKDSESPIKVSEIQKFPENEYLVIVGTLLNMEEAQVFCNRYKNLNLHIHPRSKYVSVYTEAFPTKEEAIVACRNAMKIFPDAWICKK